MIDFSLNEEQKMLQKSARDFLEKECPESLIRKLGTDPKGYSPELWKKMAELGWLGIIFPEQYKGIGGNMLDLMVINEEIGRALMPSPYLSSVVLVGKTILEAGTEAQKKKVLPEIADGDLICALALTEPESSWEGKPYDPEGVNIKAVPDGDDYVIDGVKLFVHDAHIAEYILCATRTKRTGPAEKGITLFLVDAKSIGISINVLETLENKNKQCEVVFDKVKVPKENMVGKLNGGWTPLFKSIQAGALMLCAQMVGAGERILDITVDYAKTRVQFEMPIGINQHVQEHCVQLAARQDANRRITEYATWALTQQEDYNMEVAMAKAFCSEAYEQICWRAHQVLAGVGSMARLHIMPLYTRRGLVMQHYLGDTPYWLEKVAIGLEPLPDHLKSKGKKLGLWDTGRKRIPMWDVWKEYIDAM